MFMERTNLRKKSVKIQLTRIACKKHIVDLCNSCTGHNNLTLQEILECLYENYCELDESDPEQVDQKIALPFDLNEPFRVFVNNIEECADLAEVDEAPYNTEQIV